MWWRAVRARRRISGARPASTASASASASAAAEKSCRAVVVPRYGGPEVLEVRQGVPVPDLKPREVLVRTRAVSINPLDLRVSAPFWTYALPSIGFNGNV
jgi:reticulon-4-interacting protein 1, mitochondrial